MNITLERLQEDELTLVTLYRSVNARTRAVALYWFRYQAAAQSRRWTAERRAKASVAQKAVWGRRREARELPANVVPFPRRP